MEKSGDRVMILHWPAQAEDARVFVTAGVACLLLVDSDSEPPYDLHPLEDWERLPADERDIASRIRRLSTRAKPGVSRPRIDDHGRLIFGSSWIALSPTEARLAGILAAKLDEVVTEHYLRAAGAQQGTMESTLSSNALRVHLMRMRRRIGALGLTVHAVRGQGYVMVPVSPDSPAANGVDHRGRTPNHAWPLPSDAAERHQIRSEVAQ